MISFFDSIPAALYHTIYIYGIFMVSMILCLSYSFSKTNERIIKFRPYNIFFALAFVLLIIFFIGLRPISGKYFPDSPYYAHTYNNILDGALGGTNDERGEWLFYWFGNTCKRLGLIDREYFLCIAIVYFGCMLLTCFRLMRNNVITAIIFCFISFSCFSYGTAGIRNGMASSIMMLAITLLNKDRKWNIVLVLLMMFASMSIHKSMFLPGLCAIVAFLWIKEPKYAIYFWIASIAISAVAGNYVTQFFVNLGFDERMDQYANLDEFGEVLESRNEKAGFRIDFIIYSIMPILMTWYVTIKRSFKDHMFNLLANTYILANAFWIMVIRSEQSNRFAYLSWFLYPIVIAYPLLRMNIWEDQDRKLAIILFLYSGFTLFMFLLG